MDILDWLYIWQQTKNKG